MYNINSLYKQNLLGKLEENENELNSEKKNALKRDKTIQGLSQVLREKEKEVKCTLSSTLFCGDTNNCCYLRFHLSKLHFSVLCKALTPTVMCIAQISELCHEIEDRDDALAKAREAAHKAQLQKYQASPATFKLSRDRKAKRVFLFRSNLLTNIQHSLSYFKHLLQISHRE